MLVFPSTDAVYSDAIDGDTIDEQSDCAASSLYGELKIEAEKRISEATESVIVRFPSHFGLSTAMRDDLLAHCFVRAMLAEGKLEVFEPDVVRTLIHVRDAANIIRFALDHWADVRNETYNAASGSWTKRELASTIAAVSGGNVTFVEPSLDAPKVAKRNFTLDCGKIHAKGWSPSHTDLSAVIQELVAFFSKSCPR